MRLVFDALHFAASRHSLQRRKGFQGSPYINHLIEVAHLLTVHGEEDEEVIAAAVLHDAVEDTGSSLDEIESLFGARVRELVDSCTDDASLPWQERRRRQVQIACTLDPSAQDIKVADKISNLRAILVSPPEFWSLQRRLDYYDWAHEVVQACEHGRPSLRATFDEVYRSGKAALLSREAASR